MKCDTNVFILFYFDFLMLLKNKDFLFQRNGLIISTKEVMCWPLSVFWLLALFVCKITQK